MALDVSPCAECLESVHDVGLAALELGSQVGGGDRPSSCFEEAQDVLLEVVDGWLRVLGIGVDVEMRDGLGHESAGNRFGCRCAAVLDGECE